MQYRAQAMFGLVIFGLALLSAAENRGSLLDLGAAFVGGLTVGIALGAWLLPGLVDRLHRGG